MVCRQDSRPRERVSRATRHRNQQLPVDKPARRLLSVWREDAHAWIMTKVARARLEGVVMTKSNSCLCLVCVKRNFSFDKLQSVRGIEHGGFFSTQEFVFHTDRASPSSH